MRPTIAAASQLLLLLHLHCALCWTRQDFVDHLQISGANETYFPPIPGLPLDNIPTAWTNHIHFAVPQTTNKPQTTNHKPQTHKPQRVRSLHLFCNQFSTFPFRSGWCRLQCLSSPSILVLITDIPPSALPYLSSAKCACALLKFNIKLIFKQSKRFISQSTSRFFFATLLSSLPTSLSSSLPPHIWR